MARRSSRRRDSNRTKVGEHNGVDIYFNVSDKRFSATWRVYRGTLWAKSFDGLTTKLDRINAQVFLAKPQTVLVEDYRNAGTFYAVGKTTGRFKFEDTWRNNGQIEVRGNRDKARWYDSNDVIIGDAKLAKRLNQAVTALCKAENTLDKLHKGLKKVKLVRPSTKKTKKTVVTSTTGGGSIAVTVQ